MGLARSAAAVLGTILVVATTSGAARAQAAYSGDRLIPVIAADQPMNGVTLSGRRVFVSFPHADPGVRVAEQVGTVFMPYPDAAWNQWTSGRDPATGFVLANALRIGTDGALWVVDAGSPGLGKPAVPGGAKVVQIDIATNRVMRVYSLAAVASARSFIDDIRFNGHTAYLTDAGDPGLIVLDLDSGKARRVLDGDPSVTDQRPVRAEGGVLTDPDGRQVKVNADQLEVSPDGRLLYFMPSSGPMYRIETRFLDDASLAPAELAAHVVMFADVPSTGGTAMDAAGTIYLSDPDHDRVLRLTPDARISILVEDPRLVWVDAMWIDDQGYLWMPAAQMNRTSAFQNGKSTVELPVTIYKLPIGAAPLRR